MILTILPGAAGRVRDGDGNTTGVGRDKDEAAEKQREQLRGEIGKDQGVGEIGGVPHWALSFHV